jgi:hypothetical protein
MKQHPIMILAICLTLAGGGATAQTVLIEEDLRGAGNVPGYGMNRRHFRHVYLGFQIAAGRPEEPGARIRYGRSWTGELGLRYKRRFNNTFSAGYEVFLKRMAFAPRQEEGKRVPGPEIHDRERVVLAAAGLGLYQRINFGARGDYIGRFADLGAYGEWLAHGRHVSFSRTDDQRIRIRRSGLPYAEALAYGVMARIGFNNLVVKGNYRLSDLFTPESGLPEWPRLTLGLEFGLHPG